MDMEDMDIIVEEEAEVVVSMMGNRYSDVFVCRL